MLIGAMIAAALYASTAAAFTWITGECGPGRYKDAIGECQPDEH